MTDISRPHSLRSVPFWRAYWITLRPYLFFISGVTGLVGLAMPGQGSRLAWGAGFAALFLSYGFGQALTDVFQTDTDKISSPYRPLTQGLITGPQVLTVSLLGLLACTVALVVGSPYNLLVACAGVVGLALYTPLKRRWWGGPPWNAWIVALLPVMGFLSAGHAPEQIAHTPALWAAMGSAFFSYAVFVLLGYFKDISADRAAGYRTLPVVAGWVPSVAISAVLAAASFASSLWLLHLSGLLTRSVNLAGLLAGAMWIAGAGSLAWAHPVMLRTREERQAYHSIAHVVRGYALLHAAEAAALRPALALPALAFVVVFELVLAARPERRQI